LQFIYAQSRTVFIQKTYNMIATNTTAMFTIDFKNLGKVIDFLYTKNVPFNLTNILSQGLEEHSSERPEENIVDVLTDDKKDFNLQSRHFTSVESIYKKYMVGDFSKPIPAITELAKECKINIAQFKYTFSKRYGKTFYQVYMDKRMERASELLKKGYRGCEVSKMIGYSDKSSIKFNKMFQKHFGITPKRYQMVNDIYKSKRTPQRPSAMM
jgi:AraC-like DNA-binding protein